MLERKPPRRDPRVLALVPRPDEIQYATLDAWEIAGTGALPTEDTKALALRVKRLIVQTKPTVVVCAPPPPRARLSKFLKVIATVASHSGIPLVSLAGDLARDLLDEAPAPSAIAEQYPELRALGISDGEDAVRLASAALSSLHFPSRTYETTHPATPGASVAPGAPRRSRRARVPRTAPARRAHRPRARRRGSRPRAPRP